MVTVHIRNLWFIIYNFICCIQSKSSSCVYIKGKLDQVAKKKQN